MLGEKFPKGNNQVVHQITKMLKRFEHRLASNNIRLSERYINGEVHIITHFSLAGSDYVAVFERLPEGRKGEAADTFVTRPKETRNVDNRFRKVNRRDEQSVVLVGNVQFVENPEHILPTLIRVGSVNRIYSTLRHALYSSRSLGFVFRGLLPDRESGLLGMGRTVGVNELVSEVVKGTSEVVNSVSGDEANFDGRGLNIEYAVNVISRLRVSLSLDSIWFAIEESFQGDFQITDVLFGPFNFYADERKSVVSGHEDSP